KLKVFPDEIAARERIARSYSAGLADLAIVPGVATDSSSVWAQYTLRLLPGRRDRLAEQLKRQGIPTGIYYPTPLHLQEPYRQFPVAPGGAPVSEQLAQEVISLPMHAYLEEVIQDRIIAAVREALTNGNGQCALPLPSRDLPASSAKLALQGMIKRIFTVGGLTLLSRLTGFARDLVLAAVLGAGPLADAFFVALRLPNHFRAIFAEGAFNAAFVPAYARIHKQGGADAAGLFGDRVFTLLLGSQIVLLLAALAFTPWLIALLAPGFESEPVQFEQAVALTRITFPYLLLVSLVTLYGGILNALARFAAAAAAPVFLNLTMIMTLAVATLFPTPGHAAAWGVFIAGILEVLLVGGD